MKYLLYLITYLSQYTESFMSIKEYRLHYNDIKVSYYYRYILYIYTSDGVIVQNQRNWFVHTIYKTQYGFNRNVYWNSKQNQYMRFVERLWKPWSYLDFLIYSWGHLDLSVWLVIWCWRWRNCLYYFVLFWSWQLWQKKHTYI